MKNLPIEKDLWQRYFDDISDFVRGQQIEIEIASLDMGDQVEEDWSAFEGLSYDPREDLLAIQTASLEHIIISPREVIAAMDGANLNAILVKDTSGRSQILKFKSLLRLMSSRPQ